MVKFYSTTIRNYCFLLITLAIIFYSFASDKIQSYSYLDTTVVKNDHPLVLNKSSSDNCKWTFDHYSPSLWETYWHDNIDALQNKVCPTLTQDDQLDKSVAALQYIISAQETLATQSKKSKLHDKLLSKMYYQYECSDSSQSNPVIVSQYIEPLIGLLRDPLSICSYKDLPSTLRLHKNIAVQSKRFFLLGPSAPYQNFEKPIKSIVPWLYPGDSQKILFDLGSSRFNGMRAAAKSSSILGTRWFYEYFHTKSLLFDRIIAFEAYRYQPREYWEDVPDDVMGRLAFINTGIKSTGKFNPWNILKSIAKVEDYVIIKLDIHRPTLESELMKQILEDRSISSLIDEMFFEMHVGVKEMNIFWHDPPGELKDSYILFRKLRDLGIRMHSWS